MQTLHFSIIINAPKEKVWNVMLDDATYRDWTTTFNPGSYYVGDWSKGSKVLFLGPHPDGSGEGGMVSRIAENKPYEFVSIEHLGEIHNGVEDTTSDAVKKWLPAFENYTFTEQGDSTLLEIDLDTASSPESEQMKEMFKDMWPKALLRLKEICERAE